MTFKIFSLLLTMSIFTGCAQYRWQKEGATKSDFNRDRYECQIEATMIYPVHNEDVPVTPDYTSPTITNCSGNDSGYISNGRIYGNTNVNCISTPGRRMPGASVTIDTNTRNRSEIRNQCLQARGWELIRVR